jgi:molecular chaperone GrpE
MKHKKASEEEQQAKTQTPETDNIAENQESAGTATANAAEPTLSVEDELLRKASELNDRYLRLHAEFDNYRKRSNRERVDLIKTASEDLIIELLPVLDDFERAVKSFELTENVDVMREGFNLIYNKFRNTLISRGLKEIKTIGEEFSVDFHEAIAHMPAPQEDLKNKVIDEVQKGYTLNEKVIRYAKVVVGR